MMRLVEFGDSMITVKNSRIFATGRMASKQRVAGSSPAGIATSITATVARFQRFNPLKNNASDFTHIHSNTRHFNGWIRGIFGEFIRLNPSPSLAVRS